jgi:hypothetical protein
MTVTELLERMPSAELTEWMALIQIENSEREQAAARAKAKRK